MTHSLQPGTVWIHHSPSKTFGEPRNLPHVIVEAGNEGIVTWSYPTGNAGHPAGFSWLGSAKDFAREFRPAQ